MVRGSRTLELRPDVGDISDAPRARYLRNVRTLLSFPARSGGHVPSKRALTLGLSRMLRGLRTLETRTHFGAISHARKVVYHGNAPPLRTPRVRGSRAPRVAYSQFAPLLCSFFARSEGHVPSICALTLKLPHTLRGSRALNMCSHFEAILHAPRVAHPEFVPLLRS